MKGRKITWNVGRKSICGNEKSVDVTYRICPSTRKALKEFCRESGNLRSLVVNEAILSYIKNNREAE